MGWCPLIQHPTRLPRKRGAESHATLVIFPPVKLANRLSERVSTFGLRWIVNLFEAVTIFLHLRKADVQTISGYVCRRTHKHKLRVEVRGHARFLLCTFVGVFTVQLLWLDKLLQSFGHTGSHLGKTHSSSLLCFKSSGTTLKNYKWMKRMLPWFLK